MISSGVLPYSGIVCLSSCRSAACCSLGALDRFTLGTYDGTDLGSTEGSTERGTYGKVEGFLLGD